MSFIDVSRLERDHGKFLAQHNGYIEESAKEAAAAGELIAKKRPGFTPRRARGAASRTKGRVIRRGKKTIIVQVQNSAKHAVFLEKGTRPHIIAARPFKKLRFKVGGQVIYRKSVRHPGTPAYRFLSKSRDVASRKFEQVMRPRMLRAAKSF